MHRIRSYRLNDSSLFEARNTLARNNAQPLFCAESSSRGPCTARYVSSTLASGISIHSNARDHIHSVYLLVNRRCKAKRRTKAKTSSNSNGSGKGRSDGYASSGYESTESTGSCRCNNAEIGGGPAHSATTTSSNTARNRRLGGGETQSQGNDVETVLRDGRVQALVEGLWIKVVSLLNPFILDGR